jgi:hypothetical protein
MAMKKILMLVGDFVEDYEVMVPFQAPSATGSRFWPRKVSDGASSVRAVRPR